MNWLKGAMWRLFFAAILIGGGYAYAANNFPLTVGSGTTFASLLISAVEYPIHVLCDATAGGDTMSRQSIPAGSGKRASKPIRASILSAVQAAIPAGTNLIGNAGQVYPAGSTPITASATGTTTATTATLAANASLHTYICGFSIRANATGAATNNATVTGTVTGTLNFTQWTAPLASGLGVTEEVFSPCVISGAVNTGVAVVSGARRLRRRRVGRGLGLSTLMRRIIIGWALLLVGFYCIGQSSAYWQSRDSNYNIAIPSGGGPSFVLDGFYSATGSGSPKTTCTISVNLGGGASNFVVPPALTLSAQNGTGTNVSTITAGAFSLTNLNINLTTKLSIWSGIATLSGWNRRYLNRGSNLTCHRRVVSCLSTVGVY